MSWPLLFLPCQHRDLSTWPCLSCRLWAARLAFHMERAPSPSAQPRRDVPALTLHSIHKKKKNLDLKTCEHIIRKKVSWKNVVRMSKLGLGHRKWLRPPPLPPTPTHASWGAFPSAAWASSHRAARSAEGLGELSHRSKDMQRKRLITNHAILFSPSGLLGAVGRVVHSVRSPGSVQQTSHVPRHWASSPNRGIFRHAFFCHTMALHGEVSGSCVFTAIMPNAELC